MTWFLSAGLAALLVLAGRVAQADGIRNTLDGCPADTIRAFEDMNALSDKLIAEGVRASKITRVSCITGSWGSRLWRVYVRAYDGREMEWQPSDGSDELRRKMVFGR
jgi:hypothetical protein